MPAAGDLYGGTRPESGKGTPLLQGSEHSRPEPAQHATLNALVRSAQLGTIKYASAQHSTAGHTPGVHQLESTVSRAYARGTPAGVNTQQGIRQGCTSWSKPAAPASLYHHDPATASLHHHDPARPPASHYHPLQVITTPRKSVPPHTSPYHPPQACPTSTCPPPPAPNGPAHGPLPPPVPRPACRRGKWLGAHPA